ncbi:MAG: DUF438 domain-containing protein [Anaerorhabdus sp.]
MSEFLEKNKDKVNKLKSLIIRLHNGEDQSKIKEEFVKEFKYVSGSEIVQIEQQLVKEGIKVEEIMGLCDIHASLFKDNLSEIHSDRVNHPFDYFKEDNKKINDYIQNNNDKLTVDYIFELYNLVDSHYGKKEQLLFPLLEYANITTIPQVMWGVDNEIREDIKKVYAQIKNDEDIKSQYLEVENRILEMITKENNVLYQVLQEHISNDLWDKLDHAIKNEMSINLGNDSLSNDFIDGEIQLPSGKLSPLELEKLLNILPIDITFVNKEDRVVYVSQGKDRIFERPLTVIGREVKLCHPPQSAHIVESIINDFKSKKKNHEFFWIKFKGMYVYIQYFAVYDNNNDYLGVVEVSQNIQHIQSITGEKRLAD